MTSMTGYKGGGTATGQGNRPMAATGENIPKGYEKASIQQFTPEQMQLFQSLMPYLQQGGFLSQLAGGDQSAFEQMEAPALKQFSGLQGNIASRFSGMGTGGRKSSGFSNTMNTAASDFAQQLQSNRMNLQRQALQDLFGLSQGLMSQRPYENYLVEKPTSFWSQLAGAGAGAAAGAGGGALAGSVVPGIGTGLGALLGGLGGFGAGWQGAS